MDILNYWKQRCLAAEEFISKIPCDPDITDAQVEAHENWQHWRSSEQNPERSVATGDAILTNDDNKKLQQEIERLKEALGELVAVKKLKDDGGRTPEYLLRQPIAWMKAKEIITAYNQQTK